MDKIYPSWLQGHLLKEQITNPNIEVGDYTYYSGYYHEKKFEDICVRYLLGDKSTANYKELFGKDYKFDQLKIGRFCSIGSGVSFILAGNQGHNKNWISTYPFYYQGFENAQDGFQKAGDTIVGNDVWIGTEAMIMPGVKIGDGAVIGARALVTKDVEPYTIVGGNPAKEIKKRFTNEEISMLLEIKWWYWDIEKIKQELPFLCSSNIKEFYNKIYA